MDITFAALSGLWRLPPEFGREKADQVRIGRDRIPSAKLKDIDRWLEKYPNASGFIASLYQQERSG